MIFSSREIDGFEIAATDGDIGKVSEVLFDDRHWTIRHVVVDTGGWLTGRKVLVSPHSITGVDRGRRRMEVRLTREQIENAPDIDTDKPVSRQQESLHYDYYGYPYYWAGTGLWGAAAYPLAYPGTADAQMQAQRGTGREVEERADAQQQDADPHLRSSEEVTGYRIEASDGSIGHIEDFLFDADSWEIRQAVVDTRNWWPGKKVLIEPSAIQEVDWGQRQARVRLSRDQIKSSPPYDPDALLASD